MCRPPLGAHFLQLIFYRCGHLGWPRVNLWLAVGAPTRGRHVSKESAKSCRRLEERGPAAWSLSRPLEIFSRQGVRYLGCGRRQGQREFRGYDNFRRETGERGKEKAGEGIPLTTVRNSGELWERDIWERSFELVKRSQRDIFEGIA